MERRSFLLATFGLLASCATQAPESPGPIQPTPVPDLADMIVIRPAAGFDRGDTLRVSLGDEAEADEVQYYQKGRAAGSIPLETLGPLGEGSMIVTADQLNVRRCRSRGCSVIGYIEQGQVVRVHDFVGSWFRFTGPDGVKGYIHSDGLRLPSAYRAGLLRDIRARTGEFYQRELGGLTAADGRRLFSSHQVSRRGELLSFEFTTPVGGGHALDAVCAAMRRIARFVEEVMAEAPAAVFSAFSAGVYTDTVDGPTSDNMVAGMATGGQTFCRSP